MEKENPAVTSRGSGFIGFPTPSSAHCMVLHGLYTKLRRRTEAQLLEKLSSYSTCNRTEGSTMTLPDRQGYRCDVKVDVQAESRICAPTQDR